MTSKTGIGGKRFAKDVSPICTINSEPKGIIPLVTFLVVLFLGLTCTEMSSIGASSITIPSLTPSSAIPSSAIPSSAIPSSAIPSNRGPPSGRSSIAFSLSSSNTIDFFCIFFGLILFSS